MPLAQTEMPRRLQPELAVRGVRLTEQRRAILQVIETAKRHLDAACILRLARRINAAVARSTVYRTLHLLKHHGLIDELDLLHLEGERHYYERKHEKEHVHMACLRCGEITEFMSELFDTLKNQLRRDCQYHIVVARLEVGGYCSRCRR
jgi:Fur family transcriptional regulator, ferric uptake regulator